jgi:hypothetical protein
MFKGLPAFSGKRFSFPVAVEFFDCFTGEIQSMHGVSLLVWAIRWEDFAGERINVIGESFDDADCFSDFCRGV